MTRKQERAMSTGHDPLCPEYGRDYGECFSQSFSDAFCQCDFIAKVRADERDQATHDCIAAVEALWPVQAATRVLRDLLDKGQT